MKIEDIENHRILPFEDVNDTLKNLFSFFLHKAPTIESQNAIKIDETILAENWNDFKGSVTECKFVFLPNNAVIEKSLEKNELSSGYKVGRKTNIFVCKVKTPKESEYECVLRHIRNSIAHDNVFVLKGENRIYILNEDFNSTKKMSAKILLSQSVLAILKRKIFKQKR